MDMNESSGLAGGPGTATIAGKTFLVDHYTNSLLFTVYEWAAEEARKRFNPIRELAEAMKGLDFPDGYCQAAFLDAAKLKISGDIPGELITRMLRTAEGVAFQLGRLTRTHHREMTLVDCRELVGEENRIDAYVELDRASGANIVVKVVAASGFFQPASSPANIGSSATAAADSTQSSTEDAQKTA